MKDLSTASDRALIEQSRAGDREAFAELWRRHSGAALTVARSFTSLDADDVVAEAFAKVFAAIRGGGGPLGAFRPYLFTTVRNVASSWGRVQQPVQIDDPDTFEDPTTSEDEVLASLDRSTTARAFRSLPTRWQEVLWYTEVESMSPRHVSALLGMKPNAVAALAVRAREGLRQAWISAHLSSATTSPECRTTIERLAAYTRGSLGARASAQVADHLAGCAQCQIVAEEASHIGSRIALVLLPLAAGLTGAGAYLASLQHGAAAVATAAGAGLIPGGMGSGSGLLGGHAAFGGTAGGSGMGAGGASVGGGAATGGGASVGGGAAAGGGASVGGGAATGGGATGGGGAAAAGGGTGAGASGAGAGGSTGVSGVSVGSGAGGVGANGASGVGGSAGGATAGSGASGVGASSAGAAGAGAAVGGRRVGDRDGGRDCGGGSPAAGGRGNHDGGRPRTDFDRRRRHRARGPCCIADG
ncbi:sigma-70 family RNA polymerase sigma factor [Herbiconiux sp. UC225_62]|uniref:sigma-70 family RNA polymerase sigma factor n=1 Tax=Herbiconiux sp. UC225_62 TaxID=3350168 RepID=UPI0036D21115